MKLLWTLFGLVLIAGTVFGQEDDIVEVTDPGYVDEVTTVAPVVDDGISTESPVAETTSGPANEVSTTMRPCGGRRPHHYGHPGHGRRPGRFGPPRRGGPPRGGRGRSGPPRGGRGRGGPGRGRSFMGGRRGGRGGRGGRF